MAPTLTVMAATPVVVRFAAVTVALVPRRLLAAVSAGKMFPMGLN